MTSTTTSTASPTTTTTTTNNNNSRSNKIDNNNNQKSSAAVVILSLQDYATFQYMLSPPYIASKIVNEQVVTCTFYIVHVVENNANNSENKNDSENDTKLHLHVKRPNGITLLDYYLCCFCVLPSHLLGMSQWISHSAESSKASETESESSASSSDSSSSSSSSSYLSLLDDKIMSKRKVLRRFQYSYYCGLFHVTTYHLAHTNDSTSNTKFHIVEFFDITPRYYGRWLLYIFVISFYTGIIVALVALPYLYW